jgi:hypothetical protein
MVQVAQFSAVLDRAYGAQSAVLLHFPMFARRNNVPLCARRTVLNYDTSTIGGQRYCLRLPAIIWQAPDDLVPDVVTISSALCSTVHAFLKRNIQPEEKPHWCAAFLPSRLIVKSPPTFGQAEYRLGSTRSVK